MHQLPALAYPFEALEPHIDARTMEIHHDKHHATYVANLNKALEAYPQLAGQAVEDLLRSLDQVPETIRTVVRNHGGGHANHSLFWSVIGPGGGGRPTGDLAQAIDRDFGSFESLQEKLTQAAVGQFGSGWGWLVAEAGRLAVVATPNQDSPLMQGKTPVLGVDVWEHAYYLKYQNRRPEYVSAWWNTIQWSEVARRHAQSRG